MFSWESESLRPRVNRIFCSILFATFLYRWYGCYEVLRHFHGFCFCWPHFDNEVIYCLQSEWRCTNFGKWRFSYLSACLFRIGFNLHWFWQLNIFIPLSLFVLNLFLLASMLIVVYLLINSVILPLNTRYYGHKAISDFLFKQSTNSIAGAGLTTFLFLKRGCQPGNGWFLIIQNDNASFEISSCQALCRALEYAGSIFSSLWSSVSVSDEDDSAF